MARYGVVDASPAEVDAMLARLAAALVLPAPAPARFLFPGGEAFYAACTESVITLQRAARKVIEHLGLRCGSVVVTFVRQLGAAGRVERDGDAWFIEIDDTHRASGRALGAILAHECCHVLLIERGVYPLGNALDEVYVDLAVMLTGLGALSLGAIRDDEQRKVDRIEYSHQSFGYLRAPRLERAYARVCRQLGVARADALAPLTGNARVAVGNEWLRLRLRPAPPLTYAPHGGSVIVACASLTCTSRLRLPADRPGVATCPTCRGRIELDGRQAVFAAASAPTTLTLHEVPTGAAPSGAELRARLVPLWTKVVAAIFLALLVLLLLSQWV